MGRGITKLSVAGFKSIAKEASLDIKPLTLLAGANSSGKSSFMQPLLLLKQTLAASHDPELPLTLNGGNAKFTSVDQFLTKEKSSQQKFSIEIYSDIDSYKTVFGSNKCGERLTVEHVEFKEFPRGKIAVIQVNMTKEEMLSAVKGSWRFERAYKMRGTPDIDQSKLCVARNRFFLEIVEKRGNDSGGYSAILLSTRHAPVIENIPYMIHVPGLRGNPERAYPTTGTGPTFPGTFEHYTASIIANWKDDGRLNLLCNNLESIGLTSRVSAKRLNDAQIEVLVGRLPKNGRGKSDMVNIADVGFGVSQTLPVLVALLVAKPGQLVYLEQPEIHLHPRAQRALAEILVEAANRGVKVVAETHSSLLLLSVQTLIAQQKIDKNNVALHWFQRDKTGMTEVTAAELDDAGRFGEWPVDFVEVELEAEGTYIDAITTARRGRK